MDGLENFEALREKLKSADQRVRSELGAIRFNAINEQHKQAFKRILPGETAPYRFNFYLSSTDDNNTFQNLVNKIPLFYPWATIGEVILRSNPAAPGKIKPT